MRQLPIVTMQATVAVMGASIFRLEVAEADMHMWM
jgi:hypothetical protein